MDPMIIGSLIGAGSQLIGSLVGGNNNSANRNAQALADANIALQEKYAQHGVLIRARDVMNAYKETGIHPLQLLGGGSATYSPVSAAFVDKPGAGEAIGRAGQSIERGIYAAADREQRRASMATTETLNRLAIERGGLENDILRLRLASDAARLTQSPSVGVNNLGPSPDVIDGQNTNTELRAPLRFKKDESLITKMPGADSAYREPVLTPSVGWSKNSDGSFSPLKAKAFAERTEEDFWNTTKHFFANTVRPMFNPNSVSPPFPARYGYRWYVDWKGDWHHRRDPRIER